LETGGDMEKGAGHLAVTWAFVVILLTTCTAAKPKVGANLVRVAELQTDSGTVRFEYFREPSGDTVRHGDYALTSVKGRTLVAGSYVNGMKHGVWRKFSTLEGSLVRVETWNKGKQDGPYQSYPDITSNIWREAGNYANGKREGCWLAKTSGISACYENQGVGLYENGLKQGLWRETCAQDPSEECYGKGHYKDGKREGTWLFTCRDNPEYVNVMKWWCNTYEFKAGKLVSSTGKRHPCPGIHIKPVDTASCAGEQLDSPD
jgi:antitoxin component YwqK of YwqJK toxin-antitoxin module